MKNSMKIAATFLITISITLLSSTSAFAQKMVVAGNSGNVIQKNSQYFYEDISCGPSTIYPESSSTTLFKANGTVKLTIHVDMTGSCLVPTSGGAIQREEPLVDGGGNIIAIGIFKITPSGMATYKVTF